MKLHYSQTKSVVFALPLIVLIPYEITLFSNYNSPVYDVKAVLLPYEITLFSNNYDDEYEELQVLLPYEITLFSN